MKRRSKLSLLLILVLSLSLFVTACGDKNEDQVKDEGEKPEIEELEESEGRIESLNLAGRDSGYPNPYLRGPRGPSWKEDLIFDSLLEKDKEGLIPWLAESYEMSEDGLTYTFTLREGVEWQDGEDLTPEDVKFSYEYAIEHPPVKDLLRLKDKVIVEDIEIDGNDIIITVDEANVLYLENLAFVRILPKHIWEDVEDPMKFDSEEAFIGSGPYILVDYIAEEGAYKYKANDDFWGPEPVADEINMIPVSDNILAFENGEIDLIDISADLLPKYEADDEFATYAAPAFAGSTLIMNMEKRPEFLDKDYRKGLYHAIDREEIVEKINRGAAMKANPGYLTPDHVFYNPDIKDYDFDLDKAKELIGDKEYEYELLVSDSDSQIKTAELIKSNFEKVGITLNVKAVDSKTRDQMTKDGDYELTLSGYGGWGYNGAMSKQFGNDKGEDGVVGAIIGYSNDEISDLVSKEMHEMDPEKRRELLYELQEVVAEELPVFPLVNTIRHYAYRPAKHDGWTHAYDQNNLFVVKIAYVDYKGE